VKDWKWFSLMKCKIHEDMRQRLRSLRSLTGDDE
jgi:hypothetical protein